MPRLKREPSQAQVNEWRRKWEDLGRNVATDLLSEQLVDKDSDKLWWLEQRFLEFAQAQRQAAHQILENILKTDKYLDEEVKDTIREYPPEFKAKGPKPIQDQIKILADAFKLYPGNALAFAKQLPAKQWDERAQWYAFPCVEVVAEKYLPGKPPLVGYCYAMKLLFEKLAASRSFSNDREGQVTEKTIRREVPYSGTKLAQMVEAQKRSEIVIVAAQFGWEHRGRSVYRAFESFSPTEYGLGAFEVGCMIYAHPERFGHPDPKKELGCDCPGDQISLTRGDGYNNNPCYSTRDGTLRFKFSVSGGTGNARDECGAVTGYVPERQ